MARMIPLLRTNIVVRASATGTLRRSRMVDGPAADCYDAGRTMTSDMSSDGTEGRKLDHLRIVLGEDVNAKGIRSGFDRFRFRHRALPELDLREIGTSISVFGKTLRAPLLISSMTGGADRAEQINLDLAAAAESLGVGMGVGSQRAALANESLARTYQVRRVAPTALILANLGAVQLNYGYGVD